MLELEPFHQRIQENYLPIKNSSPCDSYESKKPIISTPNNIKIVFTVLNSTCNHIRDPPIYNEFPKRSCIKRKGKKRKIRQIKQTQLKKEANKIVEKDLWGFGKVQRDTKWVLL